MSQEWFYTKNRQGRFGPVSLAELEYLVASGELAPTDMVWKQGLPQWMPISALQGAAVDDPPPRAPRRDRAVGEGSGFAAAMGSWCLPIAALIMIPAVILALVDQALPSLIVAGVAVLPGLIAFFASFASPQRGAILAGAVTALLLAAGAILFSVNSLAGKERLEEANKTITKAKEVEQDRLRAETARKEAKEYLDKGERTLEEASRQPKENAKILEAIVAKTNALDAKRSKDEADFTKRDTMVKASEKQAQEKLQEALKTEKDAKAKLDLAAEKEKQALDRLAEADKKEKEGLDKLAEAEKRTQLAIAKEKEVGDHLKKVREEYENLRGLLRARLLEDRRKVIIGIGRVGPPPAGVDFVPRDIHRELVEIAIKSPKTLRVDSLASLTKIEPTFARLASTLVSPTKLPRATFGEYITAIGELPNFPDLGLPVIQAHLNLEFDWLIPADKDEIAAGQQILQADVQALGKILEQEKSDESRKILMGVPDSKLARKVYSSAFRMEVLTPHVKKIIAGM